MSRAALTITRTADRRVVAKWAEQVPFGTRVEFKHSKRSIPQNDRMWAMLTEVARQVEWHGQKLTPEDWKLIFLAALSKEARLVPNISGDGYVDLRRSSDLTKSEMSDLIELIFAFGAEHNVAFKEYE